jgi:anti-sigma factor RsiW
MECNDIRRLLDLHTDGELDFVRQLELEEHLRACPACALRTKGIEARREALRGSITRYGAPRRLRDSIQSALRAEKALVHPAASRRRLIPWPSWAAVGMAASLALVLAGGYAWGSARARTNSLFDDAISDHVRSLQAGHLMDVASTDQHTVRPWFVGRLDFSPPVIDLAEAGFPLAGGRLEHIDGRPAAALVFHRRLHTINLFVWPASEGAVPARRAGKNGYNAESWSQGGLNFLAVSEISGAELGQFAEAFRSRAN